MKKVFKYGTGQEVPEGAQYLKTVVEPIFIGKECEDGSLKVVQQNVLVWHYFLVEVKK